MSSCERDPEALLINRQALDEDVDKDETNDRLHESAERDTDNNNLSVIGPDITHGEPDFERFWIPESLVI